MKYIILFFFPFMAYSQGIEPFQIQGSPYENGIIKAITKVYDEALMDSVYLYQHSNLSYSKIDSMKYKSDTLYLYTQDTVFKARIVSATPSITSLNGLTNSTQTFSKTTNNADFSIVSSGSTHTFNLPFEGVSTGIRLGQQSKVTSNSVAVGYQALGNALSANNVAIGYQSLFNAGSTGTGGTNNVGVGLQSLFAVTTGIDNFGLGSLAGSSLNSGSYNVAIGANALQTATAANNNVCIGRGAGRILTGNDNTLIGYTTGWNGVLSNTVAIGSSAGFNANTSNSVFLGSGAGYSETGSNRLYIENSSGSTPLIGGDFSTNVVGINTTFANMARTLTVTGEMRVTDLTTDTPTGIVGHDAQGDFGAISVGSGLNLTSGTLTANDVSNNNEQITSVVSGGVFGTGNTLVILESGNSFTGIIPAMTGATNTVAGKQGVVPPPAAGSQNRFLRGDGTWVDNANGTVTSISTNNGITGGTIITSGTIGLTGQALALHNASSNGLFARTGAGTVANRTITGGDGITVTNGNGVSDNPTITSNTSHYAQLYYNGSASVTANASLSLLSSANYATLTYTSNGSFSNPSTNRIRCDFTGTVQIMIDATWQGGNGTSTNHNLIVYKNGSSTPALPSIDANNVALSGTNREQHTYRNGIIVDVATNDYFEFYYTAPASTTLVLPLITIQRIN